MVAMCFDLNPAVEITQLARVSSLFFVWVILLCSSSVIVVAWFPFLESKNPQPKAEDLFCPAFTFLKINLYRTQSHMVLTASAGSVVRFVLLWAGGGSCGQLLQLPELWRVCIVQRPVLRLDRPAVSGR